MKTALLALFLAAPAAPPAAPGLPLPEAPVRVMIPDATAFDAALTGAFRGALTGELPEDDAVATAWRQTQVGSKLEEQWQRLSADLPWTWTELRRLQPRRLGLALLEVGHLEAVLIVDTPLAALPVSPPAGQARTHQGQAYRFVTAGAADGSSDPDRRMGLAWAHAGSLLFLATSERALLAALDAQSSGASFAAPLPGLVSLELDLAALRADRYFKREFPWPPGPEEGRLRAALRLESGQIVEVREGQGAPQKPGQLFDAPTAVAAAWETEAEAFWPALRRGWLDPIPEPADKPVAALQALPGARAAEAEDRYLVSLDRPPTRAGAAAWEAGDLAPWAELWQREPVAGWGFAVEPDGARRLVFAWPASRDAELEKLCRATVERRAGRSSVASVSGAREIQVGPGLPALALRRTGAFLWVGPSGAALAAVQAPRAAGDVVRWGRVNLEAARVEGQRWARLEGPGGEGEVRPLTDRILGLLGWMPAVRAVTVERRQGPAGWSERVVFATSAP